jgi:hypothetical protein
VTRGEAQRLLELSREARWAFPSSMGRPVPKGDEPEWLRQLLASQASIVDAGAVLHNLGHVEARRGDVDAAERYFSEPGEHTPADDPYSAAMADLNKAALA